MCTPNGRATGGVGDFWLGSTDTCFAASPLPAGASCTTSVVAAPDGVGPRPAP